VSTATAAPAAKASPISDARQVAGFLTYMALGAGFGFILAKSEAVSWFRIQEMFRFQSFHMFGILGTAVATAGLSTLVLRRLHARTLSGEAVQVPHKNMGLGYRYILGGTVFGMGWALTGACPGPLFVLLGSGATVFGVAILSALFGTWLYASLRPKLPH
jgi:uncharacterized protein